MRGAGVPWLLAVGVDVCARGESVAGAGYVGDARRRGQRQSSSRVLERVERSRGVSDTAGGAGEMIAG